MRKNRSKRHNKQEHAQNPGKLELIEALIILATEEFTVPKQAKV